MTCPYCGDEYDGPGVLCAACAAELAGDLDAAELELAAAREEEE